jgi:small subunit ribosomal protein S3
MGHKVHPKILRIGVIKNWDSKWFARFKNKEYQKWLREDIKIREIIEKLCKDAGIDKIEIERNVNNITAIVHVARPGVIIGRGGLAIEEIRKKIIKSVWPTQKVNFNLNIVEVRKPALSARILVDSMIADLEKRVPYRRVLKQALDRVEKAGGALGAKVSVAGRLNGIEIARRETLSWGKIPLHNLRADIDYAYGIAYTIYGTIGVKAWIYKGEVFDK